MFSHHSVSSSTISRSEDKAMDRSLPNGKSSMVGLSLRNGPVEDMDVDAPSTNGANKRKSRSSISKVDYRDDSDSDGEPLVRLPSTPTVAGLFTDLETFRPSVPSPPADLHNRTPTMSR